MIQTVLVFALLTVVGLWYTARRPPGARAAGTPVLFGASTYVALLALALVLVFLWR
jgi:hypothetical protein